MTYKIKTKMEFDNLKKAIGYKVRRLRELKNLSRKELSKTLDISTNILFQIEQGGIFLDIERVRNICDFFGCKSSDILMLPKKGGKYVIEEEREFNELKKAVGEILKHYRKKEGISGERMAELLDVTYPTIYNIENGKVLVTTATLEKYCDVLEIDISDVLPF